MSKQMTVSEQNRLMRWVFRGLLGISLVLFVLLGGGERQVARGAGTLWSIGMLDDSTAEFSGTVGIFTVGADPDSAFPARLSGGGTVQTINFNLPSVFGDYYLKVVAADTAQNSTSGMEVIINNKKLTPHWAGSWHFRKWGNAGREQGVQTLRWAMDSGQLLAGPNTLQLRVSAAPNAGPGSLPDGVTPYFDMDYVSLEQASLNLAQPKRYLGSTEYWTDDAIINRKKISNGIVGDGTVWIDYLFDRNTLDSDIEIIEEMNWTTAYPDLDWKDVHIADGVWDEDAWRYYRYTFQRLREAGVDRNLIKIQYVPNWASTQPTEVDYDIYPPTLDVYWTDFIRETALRLGDIVDYYAIMNEVNMDGFWKGTQAEYEHLMRLAYDTLKQYDTIDADGDGIAAVVVPSSSNEPEQVTLWEDYYAHLFPRMDAFHTHDYKWGIKPGVDAIQSIDPSLQYIISETGPANWFINENEVPQYNPAAMASAIGYLLLDETSTVDLLVQWLLKGDPDKNAGPWPDNTEWTNTAPDSFANNDGFFEDFNTSLINIEPPGPPFTNWLFTSAGAYWQHWGWVFDWDAKSIPVEMVGNGDWQYEVCAVQYADRIEVIVTNFEGGYIPAPHTVGLQLDIPWANAKVDRYDPDDFTDTVTVAGPQISLTATDLALDSIRWVLSDPGVPQDAVPGVFIASPGKSATVSGNVTIEADAFDDGSVSAVEYRIDPINEGPFTALTLQSGSRYAATWDSTSVADGDHAIQVRVTDTTGNSSNRSHVVVVANAGGPPGGGLVMHVQDIFTTDVNGNPKDNFSKGETIYWQGLIHDSGGSPVSGADVTTSVLRPNGSVWVTQTSTTDANGRAFFSRKSKNPDPTGTYTINVTDVVKTDATYDSAANVKDSHQFTLQ